MTERERRRYEMLVRVREFGVENSADFPAGSIGKTNFEIVGASIETLDRHGANQATGTAEVGQSYAIKQSVRENLREDLAEISRTAKALAYEIEGIAEKYRLPVNRSDQQMLATARGFVENLTTDKTRFIEYGMAENFVEDLQAEIEAFETSLSETAQAVGSKVSATAEIGESIKLAMVAVRKLDAVIRNTYKGNAGKLAAWQTASHVEKAAKKLKSEK